MKLQMACRSKDANIVLTLNHIQQGLNFLVPEFWWNEFCQLNSKIDHINELIIPNNFPLDTLRDLQIMYQQATIRGDPFKRGTREIEAILRKSEEGSKIISEQLKVIHERQLIQKKGKRAKPVIDWWKNQIKSEQGYHRMLISPEINTLNLSNIFQQFYWRVVSPQLYRIIHKAQVQRKSEPYDTDIVGIPIFLPQGEYPCTMTYELETRIMVRASFYNFQRSDYLFNGLVEQNVNISDLMRQLYAGLQILSQKCNGRYQQNKRNRIYYIKNRIYYQFYDDGQYVEQLNWDSFNTVSSVKLSSQKYLQFVQYSSYSLECDQINQMLQENQEMLNRRIASKRVKQNQTLQQTTKKQGFHAIATKIDWQKQQIYDAHSYQPQIITNGEEQLMGAADVPSSTQGQTPQQMMAERIFREYPKKQMARIPYPIWKNEPIPYALKKLSQIRMNGYISIWKPFKDPNQRISFRDEHNKKKVYFEAKCNPLILNSQNQLYQKQESNDAGYHNQISTDLIEYLQRLALRALGQEGGRELQKLQVKEDIQILKQKSQFDSQTCKNEDIDSQASREY